VHLLISSRQLDGIDRPAQQYFRRYNPEHPERGGAQKASAFWQKNNVVYHRELIADVLNLHLEAHGCVERIHPKSLKARGIERVPEPKLLPSESAALRDQGEVVGAMADVLAIRKLRERTHLKEQNQARTYWEERKSALGMTRHLPMAEKLRVVVQARAAAKDGPLPRTPAEQLASEQRAIWRAIQREHARTGRGLQGPRQTPTRRSSLTAQVQRLARVLAQEEEQGHGQLRVRLHEEERNTGLSW
jgi:hypothetical protein